MVSVTITLGVIAKKFENSQNSCLLAVADPERGGSAGEGAKWANSGMPTYRYLKFAGSLCIVKGIVKIVSENIRSKTLSCRK